MSDLTPICVPCRMEMRCVKNNRIVRDPETTQFPATYWLGDEYECPVCEQRIVTGFGVPIPVNPAPACEVLEFRYEPEPEPEQTREDYESQQADVAHASGENPRGRTL